MITKVNTAAIQRELDTLSMFSDIRTAADVLTN